MIIRFTRKPLLQRVSHAAEQTLNGQLTFRKTELQNQAKIFLALNYASRQERGVKVQLQHSRPRHWIQVSWSASRPCPFTSHKQTTHPLGRRLDEAQSGSGRYGDEKNLVLAGKRTPAVQPVCQHYTDWGIPALKVEMLLGTVYSDCPVKWQILITTEPATPRVMHSCNIQSITRTAVSDTRVITGQVSYAWVSCCVPPFHHVQHSNLGSRSKQHSSCSQVQQ